MDTSIMTGVVDNSGEPTGGPPMLPTNPNRQRPRVTRACDNCKARKMRCTGKQPCAHCIKMGKTCEYKAKYTRGAAPNIESAPQDEQVKYLEKYDWAAGNPPRRPLSSHRSSSRSLSEQVPDTDGNSNESMRNNERGKEFPERPHKNRRIQESYSESMYEQDNGVSSERDTIVNPFDYKDDPATGASLYERTEKRMARRYNQQKTPVMMYGDAPLPEIDTSFFVLPPPELARSMVRKYFETAAMTRFLHSQTVEIWTTELLNSFGNLSRGTQNNAQRAVVLMVFAFAHETMFGGSERTDTDLSFHYFHAAENQLKNETGDVCLATIQARLLQCHFLLSRSRVNQTCSILATMTNFIFVLGIHRRHRPTESDDLVHIECSKRTLWQTYVVDKYIASSLGRPALLRDEDIDQDLPMMVNDDNLSPTSLITTTASNMRNVMEAGVYHIKLSIIISRIIQSFSTARKPTIAQRFSIADSIMASALAWHKEIRPFIEQELAPLPKVFQAQIIGLRISYQEMLVLLFRPFLLDDFEHHHYVDENGLDLRERSKEKVKQCLNAAWAITEIINELSQRPDNFRSSWFAHYCGYQAVVPLYVYVSKNVSSPTPIWAPYFEAASRCQDQIKVSAAKESFSQKSSGVLEELRMEAMSCIRKSGKVPPLAQQDEIGRDRNIERPDATGGAQGLLGSTSFLGGNWSEPVFDRRAPGGGILSSLNSLDSIPRSTPNGSVLDRIDRWGFSSLTGY